MNIAILVVNVSANAAHVMMSSEVKHNNNKKTLAALLLLFILLLSFVVGSIVTRALHNAITCSSIRQEEDMDMFTW